jgi:LAGLIDADG endonuclease
MGTFRIRDRKTLHGVIFPIFDKYPLLTTKHFYYLRVKKVFGILEDNTLTKDQRNLLIQSCLNETPGNYMAPVWRDEAPSSLSIPMMNSTDAKKIVSKG